MTIIQSPTGGEAAVFTWLAEKVLGGAKKALGWSWDQAQWAAAQDRYDQQVIRDYGEIRIFGQTDPKSLKDVYTDVYVLDRPTAFRRFDPETLAAYLWTEDRGLSFRHGERQAGQTLLNDADKFVILGKPGAGKTTFLKYLAVREAQRGAWGDCLGKIPIFVPLRQLAETGQTPEDLFAFIVDQFAICHFPDAAPFVEKLLREGKALVLFDGLDEVPRLPDPQDDQRGSMALTLERFARQYDKCHIAITSRIAATEYTFGPAFTYLEMADFAPEQVDAFVRNWFWDKKKPDQSSKTAAKMLKELDQPEHKGIRDLTRNPLLLTLLCLSYAETLSFPARRVEVYQEATQALLKKWDASRQIRRSSLYKTLSLGRKEQMFARIAWDGFVAGSALFSQDDLASQLVAYLQHVPEMPAAVDIDGEIVLREIVAQHGIFTEQAYHQFSFAHLTFQEYYAACYAVENAANGTLAILASHFNDPKWREVLLLTASLLPDASQYLWYFLTSLDNLVVSHPRPTGWLRWIDERATGSQTEFCQHAIRLYVVLALDLAIALARTLDLDFALSLSLSLARAVDLDCVQKWSSGSEINELNEGIEVITIPEHVSGPPDWANLGIEIRSVVERQPVFQQLRLLQAEAEALAEQNNQWWSSFSQEDVQSIVAFLNGTNLFYDCLQLAYVPDRRRFEDRIFAPPA